MSELKAYLHQAVEAGASDLFIVAGAPLSIKLEGRLRSLGEKRLLPPDTRELITEMYSLAERDMEDYLRCGDDDFSFAIPGLARFRVNSYRQRGSLAAVVRLVAFTIPDWRELGIPETVMELAGLQHGLVIVTGPAGSGKSTTQACLIDSINHGRDCHIITLEDPIEYLHRNDKSIVSQREMDVDTADCLSALRSALRQAPDVILLGEMRDPETIHTAMTAAETGHLVISTLHTRGAANAIDRIVDAFPAAQQSQIRVQLSMVLEAVVSQQLMSGREGELVSAFELLRMNPATRSLVREGKTHQLPAAIAGGAAEGMQTMDQALLGLWREGRISRETALEKADNPAQLERRL